jgi:integrase/recombinase XerD
MIIQKEVLDDWKKWMLSQGYSYETTVMYGSFIKRYIGDSIEITQRSVDKFREDYMNCVCSSALKSLFKFVVRKRNFPDSIMNIRFDRNKPTKRMPYSLSYNDVQNIIKSMPTLMLRLMTLFLFELGLRISEVLKIQWEDFNWSEWLENREEYGKVKIIGSKRRELSVMPVKPGLMQILWESHKNRTDKGIPLGKNVFWVTDSDKIQEFLLRPEYSHDENVHDYLIYSKIMYGRKLKEISKQVLGKSINPHIFRHSKGQILMDRGMPLESIKEVLRHAEISSTIIYAQASPEKVRKDLEKYDVRPSETQNNPQTNNPS